MKTRIAALAMTLALAAGAGQAQDMPFGSDGDVEFAKLLWEVMTANRLAGPGMIRATPYEGTDPHGMMLETFYTRATINGQEGDLVVKRNFGPEGVTKDEVLSDPDGHLGAYTVMFRREAGYDADNKDWFWVKFLPDGSPDKTPDGTAMAGRVAKGMSEGCIACHQGGGADLLFTTDYLQY